VFAESLQISRGHPARILDAAHPQKDKELA
jgi:hypothetical protein